MLSFVVKHTGARSLAAASGKAPAFFSSSTGGDSETSSESQSTTELLHEMDSESSSLPSALTPGQSYDPVAEGVGPPMDSEPRMPIPGFWRFVASTNDALAYTRSDGVTVWFPKGAVGELGQDGMLEVDTWWESVNPLPPHSELESARGLAAQVPPPTDLSSAFALPKSVRRVNPRDQGAFTAEDASGHESCPASLAFRRIRSFRPQWPTDGGVDDGLSSGLVQEDGTSDRVPDRVTMEMAISETVSRVTAALWASEEGIEAIKTVGLRDAVHGLALREWKAARTWFHAHPRSKGLWDPLMFVTTDQQAVWASKWALSYASGDVPIAFHAPVTLAKTPAILRQPLANLSLALPIGDVRQDVPEGDGKFEALRQFAVGPEDGGSRTDLAGHIGSAVDLFFPPMVPGGSDSLAVTIIPGTIGVREKPEVAQPVHRQSALLSAWMIWQLTGQWPGRVAVWYTGHSTAMEWTPDRSEASELASRLIQAASKFEGETAVGEWEARPNPLGQCRGCPWKPWCSGYGDAIKGMEEPLIHGPGAFARGVVDARGDSDLMLGLLAAEAAPLVDTDIAAALGGKEHVRRAGRLQLVPHPGKETGVRYNAIEVTGTGAVASAALSRASLGSDITIVDGVMHVDDNDGAVDLFVDDPWGVSVNGEQLSVSEGIAALKAESAQAKAALVEIRERELKARRRSAVARAHGRVDETENQGSDAFGWEPVSDHRKILHLNEEVVSPYAAQLEAVYLAEVDADADKVDDTFGSLSIYDTEGLEYVREI